jgi:hypothetical protein
MEISMSGENIQQTPASQGPLLLSTTIGQEIIADYGASQADNSYPCEFSVRTTLSKTTVNGQEMPNPNADSSVIFKLTGVVDKKKIFHIKDFTCGEIPEAQKKALKSAIQNSISSFLFPDKELSIGDTTSKRMTFSLPVPGLGTAQVNNIATYKLKEIQGKVALFDVSNSFSMDSDFDSAKVDLAGSGTGSLLYDYKNNYEKKLDDDMTTSIHITSAKVKVDAKLRSISEVNAEFKKKNGKK